MGVSHGDAIITKPVQQLPQLRRVNGLGGGLYGRLSDPQFHPAVWKIYCVSVLWIPILPLYPFLVTATEDGFRFHREATFWNFHRHYAKRLPKFYATVFLEGASYAVVFVAVIVAFVFFMRWLKSDVF